MTGAASFEVLVPPPVDGSTRARLGRLTLPHGVVETPAVHAGRHERDGQGAPPRRGRGGRRARSCSPTPTTCTCGPATSGSSGWAACTGSWAGTGRSSPTRAASRSCRMGDLRVIDDDGVTFKSHLDGSIHRFTPEHSIAVQQALGADVAVAFDQPVFPSSSRAIVEDAMRRTHRWAERSLEAHTRPDQALFGIVQGGLDPELRAESARFIAGLPFDGINIGGLAGDETAEERNLDARRDDPAPRRRPAPALPDGARLAARPPRRRPPRHRPVRLRAAGARRPQRPAVGPRRPPQPPQRAVPRRSAARPGRLSVPPLHAGSHGRT